MTDALILETLKYSGFALAAASAIWGMLRKTTFEDPQGHKRLTPAGYVAIAITLGAVMIAASSYGFETLIKDKAEEAKAVEAKAKVAQAIAEKLESDRRDERTLLSRALDRAEAAELRTAAANQRNISLSIAARQLALARDVSRGAVANLAKTDRALAQIGRALQPADMVRVQIVWSVKQSVTLSPILRAKIDWVVEAFGHLDTLSDSERAQLKGIYVKYESDNSAKLSSLRAKPSSFIYPVPEEDGSVFADIGFSGGMFTFLSPTHAQRLVGGNGEHELWELYDKGDYAFELPGDTVTAIEFVLQTGGVRVTSEGQADPATVIRSGELVAVQDFEEATLVIFRPGVFAVDDVTPNFRKSLLDRMRPSFLSLSLSGRNYWFGESEFRKVRMRDGTAWIVSGIGEHRQ